MGPEVLALLMGRGSVLESLAWHNGCIHQVMDSRHTLFICVEEWLALDSVFSVPFHSCFVNMHGSHPVVNLFSWSRLPRLLDV